MTKANQGRIFTRIRKMLDNDEIKGFYPKMIHEQKKVLCFKCFKEIDVGGEYTSIKGFGRTSKFFHRNCFNKMLH